jgi:hypothetical protein
MIDIYWLKEEEEEEEEGLQSSFPPEDTYLLPERGGSFGV